MVLAMQRDASNPNLKTPAGASPSRPAVARQPSTRDFAAASGLDSYSGFPEFLETLASTRLDLAFLTDADWQQVLAPLDLKLGKARRVEAAIKDLRVQYHKAAYAQQQQEQAEVASLQRMLARPSHAQPQQSPEVRVLGTTPPDAMFIPVAFFQGEKVGFVFKDGPHGLGYYRDRGRGGGVGEDGGGMRGSRRISSPASGTPTGGEAQRRYMQERELAILQQRRDRLQQQQAERERQNQQRARAREVPSPRSYARAAAEARLAASPFATG